MISFRQKVLLSFFAIFLIFVAFIFPFASLLVSNLITKGMGDRATEIISNIETAENNDALIRKLKDQKDTLFFRVALIDDQGKTLYDSHAKRILGPKFSQEHIADYPEVLQAFETGSGYHEDYSTIFSERMAYMAKAFDFHGKTYILRTAFPFRYLKELSDDFRLGFLVLMTLILTLFSLITWFLINYLTSPIQEIITAIKPYQEGRRSTIPEVVITPKDRKDEFGKLASTLNSLRMKIQNQINTLTESRAEKDVLLESLVEGVIAVDRNLMVTFANSAGIKLLNLGDQPIVGHPFHQVGQDKCEELLKTCQDQSSVLTDSITLQSPTGGKIYLDLIAAPKKDNNGALLVMQDKTSHYKVLEMRREFVANASHELKTPITIIHGFSETLHDNPDLPRETVEEITSKLMRNSERMDKLIRDLLTLADIENIPASRLSLQNLHDLTKHSTTLIQESYPNAIITLEPTDSAGFEIVVEPHLIEMAFTNLMSNGIKYSKNIPKIEIQIRKLHDGLEWKISDHGIGIPPADLERIFERFYTVNKAHSVKLGGSGLGLSIVQNIIEKHFGTIQVVSELDQGTTFTIFLPFRYLDDFQ